jgi:hypothetical protein
MPRTYKTKEQWDMFIEAREADIKELQEVIKIAKSYRAEFIKNKSWLDKIFNK